MQRLHTTLYLLSYSKIQIIIESVKKEWDFSDSAYCLFQIKNISKSFWVEEDRNTYISLSYPEFWVLNRNLLAAIYYNLWPHISFFRDIF